MKQIGCTSPFSLHLDDICTNQEKGFKALELSRNISKSWSSIKKCSYSCTYMKNRVVTKSYHQKREWQNFSAGRMEFDQFVKVTNTYIAYTELELIAEFGGYVGLFLGLSVFHLSQAFQKGLRFFIQKSRLF